MHGGGAVLRRVEALADVAAAGAGGGGRSLVRLVEMWDYEGSLSPQVRRGHLCYFVHRLELS